MYISIIFAIPLRNVCILKIKSVPTYFILRIEVEETLIEELLEEDNANQAH